jgi:hypothetical protein
MNRGVGRVLGWIFQNFWWKALALAIAVAIWWAVAMEPELSTFQTVRLEYKNLPNDLEISSDPVESVVLELRGPSGELRGVGESIRPAVILDMSDVSPGQRTFTIGDGNVRTARGVRLVRAIPSQVRLSFETSAVGMVKVEPHFTGVGRNGYQISQYTVDPPQLAIGGPGSHVARMRTAVTDPVDVSTVVGSSEFRVNAYLEDPYVRFRSSPQVTVSVTMKKQ